MTHRDSPNTSQVRDAHRSGQRSGLSPSHPCQRISAHIETAPAPNPNGPQNQGDLRTRSIALSSMFSRASLSTRAGRRTHDQPAASPHFSGSVVAFRGVISCVHLNQNPANRRGRKLQSVATFRARRCSRNFWAFFSPFTRRDIASGFNGLRSDRHAHATTGCQAIQRWAVTRSSPSQRPYVSNSTKPASHSSNLNSISDSSRTCSTSLNDRMAYTCRAGSQPCPQDTASPADSLWRSRGALLWSSRQAVESTSNRTASTPTPRVSGPSNIALSNTGGPMNAREGKLSAGDNPALRA
jgi:hypothetical protein